MIELVLSVCMLVDPGRCKDVHLTYSDVSLMTCMMAGQTEIAKWHDEHPGFKTERWRCGVPSALAKA